MLNLAILDWAILVFSFKLTHTCQDWFPPFAPKTLHSFIFTELDDGSHLEFHFLEFGNLQISHHSMSSESHSHLPRLVPNICTKNLHSFILTQLDDMQPSRILPSWIQPYCRKKLHSFILNQLDDGSLLEFCHVGFSHFAQKNFTHSFSLNLMMAAFLNSAMLDSDTAILDSDTLLSSLRFTQKHSHSTLMLTQTNSIWLKHIHSHLTSWWQPSWILPSWIWPSWIQPS